MKLLFIATLIALAAVQVVAAHGLDRFKIFTTGRNSFNGLYRNENVEARLKISSEFYDNRLHTKQDIDYIKKINADIPSDYFVHNISYVRPYVPELSVDSAASYTTDHLEKFYLFNPEESVQLPDDYIVDIGSDLIYTMIDLWSRGYTLGMSLRRCFFIGESTTSTGEKRLSAHLMMTPVCVKKATPMAQSITKFYKTAMWTTIMEILTLSNKGWFTNSDYVQEKLNTIAGGEIFSSVRKSLDGSQKLTNFLPDMVFTLTEQVVPFTNHRSNFERIFGAAPEYEKDSNLYEYVEELFDIFTDGPIRNDLTIPVKDDGSVEIPTCEMLSLSRQHRYQNMGEYVFTFDYRTGQETHRTFHGVIAPFSQCAFTLIGQHYSVKTTTLTYNGYETVKVSIQRSPSSRVAYDNSDIGSLIRPYLRDYLKHFQGFNFPAIVDESHRELALSIFGDAVFADCLLNHVCRVPLPASIKGIERPICKYVHYGHKEATPINDYIFDVCQYLIGEDTGELLVLYETRNHEDVIRAHSNSLTITYLEINNYRSLFIRTDAFNSITAPLHSAEWIEQFVGVFSALTVQYPEYFIIPTLEGNILSFSGFYLKDRNVHNIDPAFANLVMKTIGPNVANYSFLGYTLDILTAFTKFPIFLATRDLAIAQVMINLGIHKEELVPDLLTPGNIRSNASFQRLKDYILGAYTSCTTCAEVVVSETLPVPDFSVQFAGDSLDELIISLETASGICEDVGYVCKYALTSSVLEEGNRVHIYVQNSIVAVPDADIERTAENILDYSIMYLVFYSSVAYRNGGVYVDTLENRFTVVNSVQNGFNNQQSHMNFVSSALRQCYQYATGVSALNPISNYFYNSLMLSGVVSMEYLNLNQLAYSYMEIRNGAAFSSALTAQLYSTLSTIH